MNKMQGFTLVELMITIVVLGILTTIAVPGFQNFVLNSRMSSTANDLVSTLNFARSEAVKQAGNITVCASTNGSTCSGSASWAGGWVVRSAAGAIRRQQALGGTTTTLTGASSIIFSANGRMTTPTAMTKLTLSSGVSGIDGREIEVELSGRARVCKPTC
jgi:type IV fimbrial biogenesis protein FimT